MRIAVTGASGFIGVRIVAALRADGHDVRPFGRRAPSALLAPLVGYATWDLGTGPVDLHDVDALVHGGAAVGAWGDASEFHRVNVRGTRHALASVRPDARIVHISTASVYAPSRGASLTEDVPTLVAGGNAYARTKAEAERLVLRDARPGVVLRPHTVYGPGDTTLWPRVLARVRRGGLTVPGDGTARISVTHVEHLVDAVRLAVRPSAPTGVFNVADAYVPTVDELLRTVFARRGLEVRVRYVPRALAWGVAMVLEGAWTLARRRSEPPLTRYMIASLADGRVLDIARAQRALGYRPRHTIADAPL